MKIALETLWLPNLIAFVGTLIFIYFLMPIAKHVGLVDVPGGRKQHEQEIPLIGGLAMFAGFSLSILTLSISLLPYRSLLAACILLIMTGVLDDYHEISAKMRLVIQALAASLFIFWGNNYLATLGDLFFTGSFALGTLAYPLTIVGMVGIINAMNMMDGVDGLVGVVSILQLSFLAWGAEEMGSVADFSMITLMISVLLAFLCFNFPGPWHRSRHARIFMGDSGSLFIGGFLSWFLISLSQKDAHHGVLSPLVMIWIMALPLFDIGSVMIRRFLKKQSLFAPNRDHFHHLLLHKGFSSLAIVCIGALCTVMCALFGIVGKALGIASGVMFLAFLALFIVYFLVSLRLESSRQLRKG